MIDNPAPSDGEQPSPPGWYPDPLNAAPFRYWDGTTWTNKVSGTTDKSAGVAGRNRPRTIIAVGGLALAVSPFLTWANVVLLGGLNLFQLVEATGHRNSLAWGTVAVGGLSALGAWTADTHKRAQIIGVTAGLFAGLFAVFALISLIHDVRQIEGLARISYGPWVAIGGCLAMLVGGLMPRAR